GGMALVLGRFLPIIRTFAPIIAGVIELPFKRFIFYSSFGAILWVLPIAGAGYFLGTIPFVQDNLGYIIIAMVIGITTPVIYKVVQQRRKKS
ncbi:MAG: VTT domain-containing protein, partial [Bacteroidota bacterium]